MFKVKNKNTRAILVVKFEQVNVSWVSDIKI